MENIAINYLNDSLSQLIESANQLEINDEFEKGILFGYYFSISSLLNQANSFGILQYLKSEIQSFSVEDLIKKYDK